MRLLKSLYGLRQAPRAFYNLYKGHLEELGWRESKREPGLFIKTCETTGERMTLTVYVDDTIIMGKSDKQVEIEQEAILKRLPGRIIEPKYDKQGYRIYDVLGSTVKYCEKRRYFRMSMREAILRVAEKYGQQNATPLSVPVVPPSRDGADLPAITEKDWPVRACCGSLIHIMNM